MPITTTTKVLSDSGKELGPRDGFIVQGCIFVSMVNQEGIPQGGLIGSGKEAEMISKAGVPYSVFDKMQMLEALSYTAEELKRGYDLAKSKEIEL